MSVVTPPDVADDPLVHLESAGDSSGLNWFDRFYFNMQSPDGSLVMIVGGACYPEVAVEDGYVCVGRAHEQTNIRFAQAWPGGSVSPAIGPLRHRVIEPLRRWRLRLDDDRAPVAFDLVATARGNACRVNMVTTRHIGEAPSAYDHFFQSMTYTGSVTLEGRTQEVDGWLGHRDRSWGVRRTRERLGFHLWGAVHLPEGSLGVIYNEARDHSAVQCDGALMRRDGGLVRIVDVLHDVEFNEDRTELVGGTVTFFLEDGRALECAPRPAGVGFDLAGAGYDGRHGTSVEGREFEVERWDLTDPGWSAGLSMRVTGRICEVRTPACPEPSPALFEVGVTRSPSYTYRPRTERVEAAR